MGYLSGRVQRMPTKGKRGQIISDDGTLFTFALPSDVKQKITSGSTVLFIAGSRNTARGLIAGRSSHSLVGKPST